MEAEVEEAEEEEGGAWPDRSAEYELGVVLGAGATATVQAASCAARGGERCAVKRISLERTAVPVGELRREIAALAACRHECVVPYRTSFVAGDELWLVTRLLEAGSLRDVLDHRMRAAECRRGVLDEAALATVLREVLRALHYFHSHGQIHRDIKAGNVLLGADGSVQVADLGVAEWLATGRDLTRQKVRHSFVGTPCWMAPEVMEQERGYDFKADIWSFGITAIELATGAPPYHKYPPMKVLMMTLQNDPPTLDSIAEEKDQYKAYGKTFRKMIAECLEKDPKKRPTAAELLKHPFFKKAKDKKYLVHTLVSVGPSLETRVQKASKRQPGTSGRMHRTESGEWVWSEGEEEEDSGSLADPELNGKDKPVNLLQRADSSSSEEDEPELGGRAVFTIGHSLDNEDSPAKVIKLVLRMRNAHRELNDVRFEYVAGKDTAEGIARELVSAGLVDPRDSEPVAENLASLLREAAPSPAPTATAAAPAAPAAAVTFHLNSIRVHEQYDEQALVGFAQISIISD